MSYEARVAEQAQAQVVLNIFALKKFGWKVYVREGKGFGHAFQGRSRKPSLLEASHKSCSTEKTSSTSQEEDDLVPVVGRNTFKHQAAAAELVILDGEISTPRSKWSALSRWQFQMDTMRAVWKGISSPRPKPNSRPRACSSVGVDWAALGRHFDTDIDPAGCLLSGLAEWHEGGHATVLAEGGRRKMSPGSSQMGLREPRATAS